MQPPPPPPPPPAADLRAEYRVVHRRAGWATPRIVDVGDDPNVAKQVGRSIASSPPTAAGRVVLVVVERRQISPWRPWHFMMDVEEVDE